MSPAVGLGLVFIRAVARSVRAIETPAAEVRCLNSPFGESLCTQTKAIRYCQVCRSETYAMRPCVQPRSQWLFLFCQFN